MSRLGHGSKGWIGLAAYVALWDLAAALRGRETLSMAFARAAAQPTRRPWVILAWGYITAHLFGTLPARYDPLRTWRR